MAFRYQNILVVPSRQIRIVHGITNEHNIRIQTQRALSQHLETYVRSRRQHAKVQHFDVHIGKRFLEQDGQTLRIGFVLIGVVAEGPGVSQANDAQSVRRLGG